jgi:TM2 domain-containing membrane protein YozV
MERNSMSAESGNSEKSFVATLILCILLGGLGVHRFYVGKTGTGILMLLTLGGLGIWQLIDLIVIAVQKFKDSEGLLIKA